MLRNTVYFRHGQNTGNNMSSIMLTLLTITTTKFDSEMLYSFNADTSFNILPEGNDHSIIIATSDCINRLYVKFLKMLCVTW